MPETPDRPQPLAFDASVYSLDTIQRAALKFTDVCSFDFRRGDDGTVVVQLTPLTSSSSVDAVVGQFKNEVLDQHLRGIVAKETETERKLILAYAFSNTRLIDS